MHVLASVGMFERRPLPVRSVLPVAAAYVGFIVCNNLSLKVRAGGRGRGGSPELSA